MRRERERVLKSTSQVKPCCFTTALDEHGRENSSRCSSCSIHRKKGGGGVRGDGKKITGKTGYVEEKELFDVLLGLR